MFPRYGSERRDAPSELKAKLGCSLSLIMPIVVINSVGLRSRNITRVCDNDIRFKAFHPGPSLDYPCYSSAVTGLGWQP